MELRIRQLNRELRRSLLNNILNIVDGEKRAQLLVKYGFVKGGKS